jgi:hypothetical protein
MRVPHTAFVATGVLLRGRVNIADAQLESMLFPFAVKGVPGPRAGVYRASSPVGVYREGHRGRAPS